MDSDQQDSQALEEETPLYDAELYELLKNADDKAYTLATWRQEHPNKRPNLRGAPMQGWAFWPVFLQGDMMRALPLQAGPQGEEHIVAGVPFQGADLAGANLQGAMLFWANLQGARLWNAHLEGANLMNTHLESACMWNAHFEGAHLESSDLRGVDASLASVDGATLLDQCMIDDDTSFANVGLDSARIEGQLKARLKRNIRKHHWAGCFYYKKQWSRDEEKLITIGTPGYQKGWYVEIYQSCNLRKTLF